MLVYFAKTSTSSNRSKRGTRGDNPRSKHTWIMRSVEQTTSETPIDQNVDSVEMNVGLNIKRWMEDVSVIFSPRTTHNGRLGQQEGNTSNVKYFKR